MKITKDEKKKTSVADEIKVDTNSDKFSADERKEILRIIEADVEYAQNAQKSYIAQKVLDLKQYHGAKPSELEGLTKKSWMSDRNLGIVRAVVDAFKAILSATAWNPDSINFPANTTDGINNSAAKEKFTKWGMGKHEADVAPEVKGFIHNHLVAGFSCFKIYRKVWDEWVDKRVPVKNKEGKTYKWDIATEKVRFEKGVIENIADIDDILIPDYGKNIQDLPFFIHRLHYDGETVLRILNRKGQKVFIPEDIEKYRKKIHNHYADKDASETKKEKLNQQKVVEGVTVSVGDSDVRRVPVTLYEWYGYYEKNGREERYRFIVDLENKEFLSGKPLRRLSRLGMIPFAGGGLNSEPGHLRSESLVQIISQVTNALNNIYNQKSDFQYWVNMVFGFQKVNEGQTKQSYEIEPGKVFLTDDDPQKSVWFPNLQRSMAWAESDIRILFEILERLTGAASYFSSRTNQSKTLGQDLLIDKNQETRFGLLVAQIMEYIKEAISMWFELYQDYPPKGLAERIVGKDGKQLFKNLSIDDLRGSTEVQMSPDIVAGSRTFRKQMRLEMFTLSQQMPWINPQINPRGNWKVCADTWQDVFGLTDSEVIGYLGEQPKAQFDNAQLDDEWVRFMNGEDFKPPEGETSLAIAHLAGHKKQKEEKIQELADEYRPNFEAHLFKTEINVMRLMRNVQIEKAANRLASGVIMRNEQSQPKETSGVPEINKETVNEERI